MKILPNLNDKFPKYSISVSWYQNIPKRDTISGYQHEQDPDLPLGRMRNSTDWSQMFKKQMNEIGQQKYVNDWWKKYSEPHKDYELIKLEIEFVEIETWCLGWFNHWTFDIGKTDSEILQSFEEYVERKTELNDQAKREGARFEPWCVMGADEVHRWHGETQEDPAPCRCSGCKKSGVIRIGH